MANTSMMAKELQAWLKQRFPKENERHEWKEWRSLKSNISGRKGEDLVSYVSALSNMEGGCIVIGVQDKTLAVTGIADFADYTLENVVHRILGKTPGLPSLGLSVETLQASDILQHIRQFKSVSMAEVRSLLLDKLPNSLTQEQKLIKLKNLLATLRTIGLDGTKIAATGRGRTTRWVISNEGFIG